MFMYICICLNVYQFESYPFVEPVDAIGSGFVTYYDVIKRPMDFSTINVSVYS